MKDFTMDLTRGQVIDALRIHVDECKETDCLTHEMVDRVEAASDEQIRRLVNDPGIKVILMEHYYPAEAAAMSNETE
jgi:hypothetical protein